MDSRFHLTAKFKIYGKEYDWDCSLNWSADSSYEIDDRITDWFLQCHDTAYSEWRYKIEKHEESMRAHEIEQAERNELKRLKEKYPNDQETNSAVKTENTPTNPDSTLSAKDEIKSDNKE